MNDTTTSLHPNKRGRDSGAIAIITILMVPVFIVLCAIVIDVGRWYVEGERVQKAADAAALAGVTWLPQDATNAFSSARTVATTNGYSTNATQKVVTAVGNKPSQLLVTVSGQVKNFFGQIIGIPTTTITRSALADFTAPALMGSPCNSIGNQPPSSAAGAQPTGTVIPGTGEGGYTTCQSNPAFWLNVAGPATDKSSGDRYTTQTKCSSFVDYCVGGINTEYEPKGYFYSVRVHEDAVGYPITVQLYDPSFVFTADACTSAVVPSTIYSVTKKALSSKKATLTTSGSHGYSVGQSVTVTGVDATFNGTWVITNVTSSTFSYMTTSLSTINNTNVTPNGAVVLAYTTMTNPYAPTQGEANARYAMNTGTSADARTYCSGDQNLGNSDHMNTSFVLREQTDRQDPTEGVPINECTKQYAGFRGGSAQSGNLVAPSAGQLTEGNASYIPSLAQVFHQWVDLCTFTPTRSGDYYLQVRTNVPLQGSQITPFIYSGVVGGDNKVANQMTGLDESSSGHNRFAIRAYAPGIISESENGNTGKAVASQVSVSGWERLPIYVNAQSATTTFNLIQVLPNTAGQSFYFTAFDNGDATCPTVGSCTISVSLPLDTVSTDGNPVVLGTCTGTGPVTGNLSVCTANVSSNTNNGKVQVIAVPIPTNYSCAESSIGGCWWRVTAKFQSAVNDTTTWGASITGQPVRLLK